MTLTFEPRLFGTVAELTQIGKRKTIIVERWREEKEKEKKKKKKKLERRNTGASNKKAGRRRGKNELTTLGWEFDWWVVVQAGRTE